MERHQHPWRPRKTGPPRNAIARDPRVPRSQRADPRGLTRTSGSIRIRPSLPVGAFVYRFRTRPSQGRETGSIPVRATKSNPASFSPLPSSPGIAWKRDSLGDARREGPQRLDPLPATRPAGPPDGGPADPPGTDEKDLGGDKLLFSPRVQVRCEPVGTTRRRMKAGRASPGLTLAMSVLSFASAGADGRHG